MNGMRRVRQMVRIPLATNTVVVNFEQLAANVLNTAVDVILLDTTFWGGIPPCIKAAGVCETFQLGIAVHSSGELGIQLATMLHLGAAIPNLSFAADAHYHHLTGDIIEGGLMKYDRGAIRCPMRRDWASNWIMKSCANIASFTAAWAPTHMTKTPRVLVGRPTSPTPRWADPKDDRTPPIPF